MKLKLKINKAAYDALAPHYQELYAGDGDDYTLGVDGLEDTGALKRAKERLAEEVKETKRQLAEAETARDKAASDLTTANATIATHGEQTKKLTDFAHKTLKGSVALGLATKISTVPTVMAKEIAERLSVDLSGDEPKTVILGKDGKPDPALTLEKLGEEYVANKDFAAIIIGSKARGGGAPQQSPAIKPRGGGAPAGESDKPFDAAAAKPSDLAARIAERKAAEAASADG